MSDVTAGIPPAFRARRGLSEQARQILDRRLYAVLGTENDDTSVHLVPVMFLLDGRRILIETAATTRKARNVETRRHASVLVQTPDAAWAFGCGPATLVRGADADRLNEQIRAKYLTDDGERACGALLAELDDITIVIAPSRWLGWDMTGLLEGLAAGGADLDQAESWFRSDE
ncbi:MAG: pyridoxamine 5'-phosphate oxidase family protein [Acidimicrobiales bacterium]